jgi:hypothetical protein
MSPNQRNQVINALVEGNSLRATCRIAGIARMGSGSISGFALERGITLT